METLIAEVQKFRIDGVPFEASVYPLIVKYAKKYSKKNGYINLEYEDLISEFYLVYVDMVNSGKEIEYGGDNKLGALEAYLAKSFYARTIDLLRKHNSEKTKQKEFISANKGGSNVYNPFDSVDVLSDIEKNLSEKEKKVLQKYLFDEEDKNMSRSNFFRTLSLIRAKIKKRYGGVI
jgi:hypothetical protein